MSESEQLNAAVDADDASPTPEADRIFAPPTAEEAAHALRELEWSEHITVVRMAAARGNAKTYLYSLREAGSFFLEEHSGIPTLGSGGAFAWVDIDRFVDWIRTSVGDEALASELARQLEGLDDENERLETLRRLLLLRLSQYQPFFPERQDELLDADEADQHDTKEKEA